MKKNYFFALLFFCFAISSFSQVTTSNIKGLIVDDQNQALPGANIVAVHTPTGTKYGSITNFEGRYNLLNMRVGGPYKITISFVGFEDQNFTDVFLTLGKTLSLDVKLVSGNQLEEVVLKSTGGNNTFGNDRTGSETSVGKRELATLPSISRSAADFTRLDPSASGGSFGGSNDQFNNFSLDGAIFNNPFGLDAATPGGQTDAQPISLDAIDQIQVSSAPYDVTQSGFTGASVNAVTKSGTNAFHGTVYGYYRNQDLTGSKVKGEDIAVPKLAQIQSGFSVGGPIVKNKLFFFVNFEQDEREDLGQNWLPNRGTGAINESRVLLSDLNTVRDGLASIGYNTGAFEGFIHESNSTKGIFKLDWNINDNNRLAVIYNFLNASKDKPAHPTALGFRGPNASILQFENSGYEINNELKSVQVELNSTLSDNVSNKFQVGYTHFNDFRNSKSVPMPAFRIQDGSGGNYIVAGHEPFSIHNKLDQKVFQFSNNLNYSKGNHTYTIGFSFEKFQFDNSFNLGTYGYGFGPGTYTEYPDGGYVGAFFGDFPDMNAFNTAISSGMLADAMVNAQSVFDSKNADNSWALAETNVGQMAFYVQDEWSASDKFKLTYGVRVDKPLFFDSAEKAQNVIDNSFVLAGQPYVNPNHVDPNTGLEETVFIDNTQLPNNDWIVSPRLGFNWDVKGDDTFQLRGGTGLFTGRFPFVWLGNQISSPNVFFLQAVDPDYKFPQVWRTNIGVDKKLNNGIVLTADLSYTKDLNGAHVQHWGLTSPTEKLSGVDNRSIYTPNNSLNSGFGLGAGPFVFTNSDKGRIWNASLKAQKTFENGLYTMLAYNYLDAKDVNSIEAEITGDAFVGNPVVGNANNDNLGFSKYGDQHRIIGVISKKFTYGNDKWSTSFSTFFEYAKGNRFNYTYGGDINGDGSPLNDLLYVPTSSEINQMTFTGAGQAEAFETYIQQDAYLSGIRGQYAERYGAISPWRGKWDVKLIQEVKVSDDNAIQFSIDLLNAGNLISSNWGLVQQPNKVQPIGVNVTPSTDANNITTYNPVYTFNPELKETFGYDSSLLSRWQMQFGLRYIF